MADKTTLEQMLEHLVNGETDKADELFHEYVVAKSREIYEGLIESEIEDEQTEESADSDEEAVEEDFEDLEVTEGDDEEGEDEGDPTDSLMKDIEGDDDEGEEGDSDEPATKQDVRDGFDELMAKFDELASEVGGDDMGDEMPDMGGDDMDGMPGMGMKDSFEPEMATVREYVEKVAGGHGAEKKGSGEASGANTKSIIDNMKNDMGGTTANIAKGGTGSEKGTAGGLASNKPQQMNTGNVNVPGGNAGKTGFKSKEPGHGAEKKGAGEQGGTNSASLFRNK
jgi:hypothetical protein